MLILKSGDGRFRQNKGYQRLRAMKRMGNSEGLGGFGAILVEKCAICGCVGLFVSGRVGIKIEIWRWPFSTE